MPGQKHIQTTRTYMESTQTNCTKAQPESKHLTLIERQQIERWLKEKVKVAEIARRLNRHRSTIYREIQRGLVAHVNSDLSVSYIYQWDVAQRDYEKNQGGGGRPPKLHRAHPLMEHFLDNRKTTVALCCHGSINQTGAQD